MILQGVKPTIQPLGVGYANRPKKAENGRGKTAKSSLARAHMVGGGGGRLGVPGVGTRDPAMG